MLGRVLGQRDTLHSASSILGSIAQITATQA